MLEDFGFDGDLIFAVHCSVSFGKMMREMFMTLSCHIFKTNENAFFLIKIPGALSVFLIIIFSIF